MNCHEARPLLSDYALRLLADRDRLLVEEHLDSGCVVCRSELDELNETLARLGESEPLVAPPARLKASLLSRLDEHQVEVQRASRQATQRDKSGRDERGRSRYWQGLAVGLAALFACLWIFDSGEPDQRPATRDQALRAWRDQIEGVDREMGLVGTNLVSLQLPQTDRLSLSYLLLDEVSHQLHVWTKPQAEGDQDRPNWVWLVSRDNEVIDHSALARKGDHASAVLDFGELKRPAIAKILLTQEADQPGTAPSESVLGSTTLSLD